jgi:hypothetical protein
VKNFELTHVRHDRAHCLVPGLFRSLLRGERKQTKLDVTYNFGKKETVRFIGFEPLGADDMRILQGLMAIAGPSGNLLRPEPKSEKGKHLRFLLEPKLDGVNQNALVAQSSLKSLLSEVGLVEGGSNIKLVKASLLRMSNVTVIIKKGNREASFHLLSYAFDETSGQLMAALNPRLASAVLGQESYVQIDMDEVRSLNRDAARLIHQRLCAWIDPGKSGKIALSTLCEYVWPDETSIEAMKKRRQRIRKSLLELTNLSWTIHEYVKDKFEIRRPKQKIALKNCGT